MTIFYKYDAFGRRIEKNVNGVVTKYVYDGPNTVTEYDGSGNVTAAYVHNLAIDDPLSITQTGLTYFYHKDSLGTVTNLTNSNGAIVQSYQYDSFGNITGMSGSIDQPFTFTGREFDPETGLYYYRARYYDPFTGRFINQDPLGFDGGINFYAYAGNSPLNYIDPFGLFKVKICLNSKKLTLFDDNGKELFSASIVKGCKDTPTPTGKYKLGDWQTDKTSNRWGDSSSTPWSKNWWGGNVFGPYFVPVQGTGGVGIHGHRGPKLPGSFDVASIISPCSHGCIRLSNYAITTLHELMPKPAGTQVEIILNCE